MDNSFWGWGKRAEGSLEILETLLVFPGNHKPNIPSRVFLGTAAIQNSEPIESVHYYQGSDTFGEFQFTESLNKNTKDNKMNEINKIIKINFRDVALSNQVMAPKS